MLPDRVSNPGPLTYESGALPIALRGPAKNSATRLAYRKYFKIEQSVQLCSKYFQNWPESGK